jgi:hypothetical protein
MDGWMELVTGGSVLVEIVCCLLFLLSALFESSWDMHCSSSSSSSNSTG